MSSPKANPKGSSAHAGAGTLCNPVVTLLKDAKKDKTFWPNAVVRVPLSRGDLPLCGQASITWTLQAGKDVSVSYQIQSSYVFDLQGMPTAGTLDSSNPILTIPLDTGDAGAGAVVFSGSDPATSVVIVE